MAKAKSMLRFSGTLGEVTHVKSAVYGDHVRSPRGTHTPVTINEVLKESGEDLTQANVPAKIIKDALEPFRKNFKDGKLWTRLVSHFKKEIKTHQAIDFRRLEGFEFHESHPLDRLTTVKAAVFPDVAQSVARIDLEYYHPLFRSAPGIDGYRITLIGVYPSLDAKTAITTSTLLPPMPSENTQYQTSVVLSMPAGAETILLCVKLEGCMRSELSGNLRAKGMKIVRAVAVM